MSRKKRKKDFFPLNPTAHSFLKQCMLSLTRREATTKQERDDLTGFLSTFVAFLIYFH
jgi:hypothetical protein